MADISFNLGLKFNMDTTGSIVCVPTGCQGKPANENGLLLHIRLADYLCERPRRLRKPPKDWLMASERVHCLGSE